MPREVCEEYFTFLTFRSLAIYTMRLSEEFRDITEQLNELYHYKRFLEERISMLEFKLKEVGEMMDFVDSLNDAKLLNGKVHSDNSENDVEINTWNNKEEAQ